MIVEDARRMQDDNTLYQIINEWFDKCQELRRIESSRRDFHHRIDDIERARRNKMHPTRLETIKKIITISISPQSLEKVLKDI